MQETTKKSLGFDRFSKKRFTENGFCISEMNTGNAQGALSKNCRTEKQVKLLSKEGGIGKWGRNGGEKAVHRRRDRSRKWACKKAKAGSTGLLCRNALLGITDKDSGGLCTGSRAFGQGLAFVTAHNAKGCAVLHGLPCPICDLIFI